MTIEEFLEVMADNASDFPEFAELSQAEKEDVANVNIVTGPAESFRGTDGRLIGVGGIRGVTGIGEAWMITARDIRCHPDHAVRKQKFQEFLQVTQETFKRMRDEHNLWRVFATGKLSTTFLEQVGFERAENTLIWSRTK